MKTMELIDLFCPFMATLRHWSSTCTAHSRSLGTAILKFKLLFVIMCELCFGSTTVVIRTKRKIKKKRLLNAMRSNILQAAFKSLQAPNGLMFIFKYFNFYQDIHSKKSNNTHLKIK